MPLTSSQGNDLGIAGATRITIRAAVSREANKLDSSDLSIAHLGDRTYEDGLTDLGPNETGQVVTVTASGLGTKPALGDTVSAMGETCYCTESTEENSVGELQAWSATYTSDYTP